MNNYGLDIWADNNFIIDDNLLKVNYKSSPSLLEIVQKIRDDGKKGPLILRFPHLIKKQIDKLYKSFYAASNELNYKGEFQALFPLKVNQYYNFTDQLIKIGEKYGYGLEAGSKSELLIAISLLDKNQPITVNGFKDREMIELGFISKIMGHDITLTIEGINELETIIDIATNKYRQYIPNIGLRIKLHSLGVGLWAKSSGINSKFGLTSTELINAMKLLKKSNLLKHFTMIHFHIGSQITDINYLKKAIREAGNIYADLVKMGAYNLKKINLGGGLAVEYAQIHEKKMVKYSINEYANDVIFTIDTITKSKNVEAPDIFIESGRFIASYHAVLVAPVFELVSEGYHKQDLQLKEKNPPLITELYELYQSITEDNAREYLHDCLDHLNSLLTLFELGYIDLIDRSNSEVLTHLIIKKAIKLLKDHKYKELLNIQNIIQEKYLVNFSIFQSIPDFWGLKQHFPIIPLSNFNEKPSRSATIWDITCDSDGEIPFNKKNPLFLHSVDLQKEQYFLGFFLVGAYQEVLGMNHNLFTHPTEVTVKIDKKGYHITDVVKSNSIIDILKGLNYNTDLIKTKILKKIELSKYPDKSAIIDEMERFFNENGYLKTIN